MKKIKLKKENRIRILYHCFFWLGILIFLPLFVSKNPNDYFNQIKFFAITLPFDMSTVYISFYILIPNFLTRKKILTFIFFFITTGLFFIILQRIFAFFVIFPNKLDGHTFTQELPSFILITFLIYGLALTIKLFKLWYKKNQELHEMTETSLQIELKLKEAELSLLKAQLHPHFLFNTLNNLYGLTLEKSDYAPSVVLRISDMLHYMLYESNNTFVPLEKELKYIRDYLHLEKLRFGEELKLDFSEEGIYSDFEIAPLLLIPFIENAFKHGVSGQTGEAEIKIQLKANNDIVFLSVENSVEPEPGDREKDISGGVGLDNVKKRLELLYKNRNSLKIRQDSDKFSIELEIKKDD